MVVGFSCSSPICSVALIDGEGHVLFSASRETRSNASGACMELLERGLKEAQRGLGAVTLFCADLGPGSFIGVRVGVTLAKSFAFALGVKAAGATSFDLIDDQATVVLPSKKGEFFVRRPGEEPYRTAELPNERFTGYGPGMASEVVPNAARFASLLQRLQPVEPELLLPEYLIEPSISTPKKPFVF